ncbi:MAG: ankyrin repeat domain-containing protein, partial [Gammaproteobacteria bacterium]
QDLAAVKSSLKKKNVKVNDYIIGGVKPLHYAAAEGNINIVKYLLSKKANIDEGIITVQDKLRPVKQNYQKINQITAKCVAVGESDAEKTSVLLRFSSNNSSSYIPTVFDNYSLSNYRVDGKIINWGLWDVAGQEDYDRLRPLSYPQTDIFLIFFSLTNRNSFDEVKTKWVAEIKHHCPGTPFILVGTKIDERKDYNKLTSVSFSEGNALAQEIGAASYVECSASLNKNINKVFDQAARAIFNTASLNGPTPLLLAAGNGHVKIVELLHDKGASLKNEIHRGKTALLLAAANDQVEVVEWLLAHKANLQEKTDNERTALLLAVVKGQIKMVNWLLENGSSLNEKTFDGKTALLLAVSKNQIKMVQCLLAHGASLTEKTNDGMSALLIAVTNGHKAMTDYLLRGRASVEEQNSVDRTALLWAVCSELGDFGDIITSLLNADADPLIVDKDGRNAFDLAFIQNKMLSLKSLLAYKKLSRSRDFKQMHISVDFYKNIQHLEDEMQTILQAERNIYIFFQQLQAIKSYITIIETNERVCTTTEFSNCQRHIAIFEKMLLTLDQQFNTNRGIVSITDLEKLSSDFVNLSSMLLEITCLQLLCQNNNSNIYISIQNLCRFLLNANPNSSIEVYRRAYFILGLTWLYLSSASFDKPDINYNNLQLTLAHAAFGRAAQVHLDDRSTTIADYGLAVTYALRQERSRAAHHYNLAKQLNISTLKAPWLDLLAQVDKLYITLANTQVHRQSLDKLRQEIETGHDSAIVFENLYKETPAAYKSLYAFNSHNDTISFLAVVSDKYVVSGSNDGTIRLWDIETRLCIKASANQSEITALAVLPDDRIISGHKDNTIKFWNTETDEYATFREFDEIKTFAILPDRRLAIAVGTLIKIWCLETNKCEKTLEGHTTRVDVLSILQDGRLVSSSQDIIKIWNIEVDKAEHTLKGKHGVYFSTLLALPNGRLASGTDDGTISIWHVEKENRERVFTHSTGTNKNKKRVTKDKESLGSDTKAITALLSLPDGRLVSGSAEGSINFWNAETFECDKTLSGLGDNAPVLLVLFNNQLISSSSEGKQSALNVYSVLPTPLPITYQDLSPIWDLLSDPNCMTKTLTSLDLRGCSLPPEGYTKLEALAASSLNIESINVEGCGFTVEQEAKLFQLQALYTPAQLTDRISISDPQVLSYIQRFLKMYRTQYSLEEYIRNFKKLQSSQMLTAIMSGLSETERVNILHRYVVLDYLWQQALEYASQQARLTTQCFLALLPYIDETKTLTSLVTVLNCHNYADSCVQFGLLIKESETGDYKLPPFTQQAYAKWLSQQQGAIFQNSVQQILQHINNMTVNPFVQDADLYILIQQLIAIIFHLIDESNDIDKGFKKILHDAGVNLARWCFETTNEINTNEGDQAFELLEQYFILPEFDDKGFKELQNAQRLNRTDYRYQVEDLERLISFRLPSTTSSLDIYPAVFPASHQSFNNFKLVLENIDSRRAEQTFIGHWLLFLDGQMIPPQRLSNDKFLAQPPYPQWNILWLVVSSGSCQAFLLNTNPTQAFSTHTMASMGEATDYELLYQGSGLIRAALSQLLNHEYLRQEQIPDFIEDKSCPVTSSGPWVVEWANTLLEYFIRPDSISLSLPLAEYIQKVLKSLHSLPIN